MKRIPSPWLELLGALLLLLATLGASWLKPMGFAPAYMDAPPKRLQQESADDAAVIGHEGPRAKGARDGLQTLQLEIDTSTRRTDRAGLL